MYKQLKGVFKVPQTSSIPPTSMCNKPVQSMNECQTNSQLLQLDESFFLNVDIDNIPQLSNSIDSNFNLSSIESPEVNLNKAIFAPTSAKRRSSEAIVTTCKKRLLDNVSFEQDFITDTEFMRIDVENKENLANNVSRPEPYEEALLEDLNYFETQFFKQIDRITNASQNESQVLVDSQIESNPLNMTVTKLNLTQIFNDDVDDEDQQETYVPCGQSIQQQATNVPFDQSIQQQAADVPFDQSIQQQAADVPCSQSSHQQATDVQCHSSQAFLDVAKAVMNAGLVNPSQKLDELVGTTYKSKNTASMYVELQRSMQSENENNVKDDNFVDDELSQAYKSSQYKRELEAIFDNCEKTICSIDNLNNSDRYSEQNSSLNDVNGDVTGVNGDVTGVNDINWNLDFEKTPKRDLNRTSISDPSSFVRQRLSDSSRKSKTSQKFISRPTIISTNFSPKGPFFGLPNKAKTLIKDYKGIDELYDWQKECLTLPAVSLRHNLIYALPTSGGKTLVAEILILREVICRRKNCLFILPYVSIVQEKIWALSPFAVQLEFLLEEYAAGKGQLPPRIRRKKKSVYIATIEKGLALIDSLIETGRTDELGLIVVDELHIIGEPGRGATLETLLTKAMFINAGIQIVGMSATIGNLNEIATFLNADVYTREFRPVELKEYIKCGSDILAINTNATSSEDAFSVVRTVDYGYKSEVLRRDPDHLAGLVDEIIPNESCLIFCSTKKNCENVALLLSSMLPPRKYLNHRENEKIALKTALQNDGGILCPILSQTLQYGIAYHHSGLTIDERRHLEDGFRQNIISVICCTSTLAAGVNLPAKRVIIRSPYIGRDFLTLSRYKQMVGRAGRAGMGDCGESITIFEPKDNIRMIELLTAPMDEAASGLHLDDCKGLRTLILSSIGLGLTTCLSDIHNLVSKTLLSVQADRLQITMSEITNETIGNLFKVKALTASPSLNQSSSSTNIEIQMQVSETMVVDAETSFDSTKTQKKLKNVILKPSTQLNISRMGKASFKSCMDLHKSQVIYNDLMQAQRSLVLLDHLHLLYIVTPYEPSDINVTIDMQVYYTQYSKLTPTQRLTATTLGISESCAVKMMTGKAFKPDLSRTVHRFFLTLILYELWQQKPIHEVAEIFHVNRGVVQNLSTASASYASCVFKFCEVLEEFWAFRELLGAMVKRLSYCCSVELLPLMDLPSVKITRAKQLYSAGFKSLEDVAKSNVNDLVENIEHLSYRVAKQLISAAKVLLLERVETLRGEVQECLEVLEGRRR